MRYPENLILLLSVDIVGSSAYKFAVSQQDGPLAWVRAYQDFYNSIPVIVNESRRSDRALACPQALPDELTTKLKLWKSIGDQLIFFSEPRNVAQLEFDCQCFLHALQQANERMLKQWGFALHGAAWAFEEADRNLRVSLQPGLSDIESGSGFDLIGPDIDLGFRLVAEAAPGQLLVPLEMHSWLQSTRLCVSLVGEASLKGIRLDPYPLLELQSLI